jgi:hypothetical protein
MPPVAAHLRILAITDITFHVAFRELKIELMKDDEYAFYSGPHAVINSS